MKNKFSTFFYFPASLRNGFLLLFLLVWCLLSRQLWALSFSQTNERMPVYAVFKSEKRTAKPLEIPINFRLNVNDANLQSLSILSVPAFLARRWVKYLENGGSFKRGRVAAGRSELKPSGESSRCPHPVGNVDGNTGRQR